MRLIPLILAGGLPIFGISAAISAELPGSVPQQSVNQSITSEAKWLEEDLDLQQEYSSVDKGVPTTLSADSIAQFTVTKGETPLSAIRQWLQSENLTRIAWSLSEEAKTVLGTPVAEPLVFTGSLNSAVTSLGEELNLPLRLTHNISDWVVAIHTLGPQVSVHWVEGSSLQTAIKNLVKEYGWQWIDTPEFSSWMAQHDYPFLAPYAIVTPVGAVDHALDFVLEGYPVHANLVESTQLVIIREN